jgi:hypothetical protein
MASDDDVVTEEVDVVTEIEVTRFQIDSEFAYDVTLRLWRIGERRRVENDRLHGVIAEIGALPRFDVGYDPTRDEFITVHQDEFGDWMSAKDIRAIVERESGK